MSWQAHAALRVKPSCVKVLPDRHQVARTAGQHPFFSATLVNQPFCRLALSFSLDQTVPGIPVCLTTLSAICVPALFSPALRLGPPPAAPACRPSGFSAQEFAALGPARVQPGLWNLPYTCPMCAQKLTEQHSASASSMRPLVSVEHVRLRL